MKQYFSETTVATILLVLLICFINPLEMIWMPTMVHMTLLAGIITLFSLFALFVWKEQALDEREQLHQYISARFGYLFGGGILLFGITVQAFQHDIDPWLPLSLGVMVLAKIAGRLYAKRKC